MRDIEFYLGKKFTRREVLTGAATIVAGSAVAALLKPRDWFIPKSQQPGSDIPAGETPLKPDQTQELLTKIHQEVIRLLQTYPQDSIIRKVYLGNLSDISPVFKGTLPLGIADPIKAYSSNRFGNAEYSPQDRFSYFLNQDRSLKGYSTLQKQELAIYFSPTWLDTKNDDVKRLALEEEAYTLALWEPFSRIILNTYLAQGRIDKIDPQVTDEEIGRTLARQILIENKDVRKLYDYAGYLAILFKVGELVEKHDLEIDKELSYSNLPKIYNLAKLRGVKFENLQFTSREFLQLAFDNNGSWGKMILDPSIPGPVPAY